jgi:sigma-E factor negative regulatory protein RseB
MRHGLMMTAVATVTVPGLVAVFGVIGHGHGTAAAGAVAAGTALSGPFPVAPSAAPAGVRNDIAAVQGAAGMPVTVFSRITSGQQATGMRLLDQAASAGLTASYQGTEQLSQSGLDGSVSMVSEVWHQGGGQTVVQTSSTSTSSVAGQATSSATGSGSPEGVFGVTKSLVALLGRHYVVAYAGGGDAVSRTAAVVEVYRYDGSLAARYWLDRRTMLPLRRELFDTADNVISEDSFTQVQFGPAAGSGTAGAAQTPAQAPQTQTQARARAETREQSDTQIRVETQAQAQVQTPAPNSAQAPTAWTTAASPVQFRTSLAGQGWQVPAALPGGLPLYAAAWTQASSGKVVELEYSDGLYVVSLFVQRGNLTADLPGWQRVQVGGQQAFAAGHSVTWTGLGFVYTMIADAPAQTVTQVVGALPGSAPGGIFERLERGFERLASMANPFG